MPLLLKFGTAYRIGDWKFFEGITPTVDVSYRKPQDNDADIKISGGIETWFNYNTWAARFGGNDREITLGFSYNKMFKESGLQIDYAFLFPLQLADTLGSHRISLTFRYSLPKKGRKVEGRKVESRGEFIRPKVVAAPSPKVIEEKPVELKETQITTRKREGGMSIVINFGQGKSELDEKNKKVLTDNMKQMLAKMPKANITVEGHSDSDGDEKINYTLSGKRAGRICKYLIDNEGIPPEKIKVKAFGETRPIADNNTKEGKFKNRRVEILFTE